MPIDDEMYIKLFHLMIMDMFSQTLLYYDSVLLYVATEKGYYEIQSTIAYETGNCN